MRDSAPASAAGRAVGDEGGERVGANLEGSDAKLRGANRAARAASHYLGPCRSKWGDASGLGPLWGHKFARALGGRTGRLGRPRRSGPA